MNHRPMMFKIKKIYRIGSTLRKQLSAMTLPAGTLKIVLERNKEEHVFVAFNRNNVLCGWACVYSLVGDIVIRRIGVYIKNKYRHNGLGTMLRQVAINHCINEGFVPYWWDNNIKNFIKK